MLDERPDGCVFELGQEARDGDARRIRSDGAVEIDPSVPGSREHTLPARRYVDGRFGIHLRGSLGDPELLGIVTVRERMLLRKTGLDDAAGLRTWHD